MVNRKFLDELIEKNDTYDWWQPDRFVEYTLPLLPSGLEVHRNPPEESENFNCFLYVLGLSTNKDVLKETGGFIYDTFFQKLIELGELTLIGSPQNGDFIVYQDVENYPERLTHAGVIDGDTIISKWAWGPLIQHALWDVPASYGNDVFYVESVTPENAKELYFKYKEFNIKPT